MSICPDRALDFLEFVQERHLIWEQRQHGEPQPWTADPVLATRKFTNVFRLLDQGTQFVLTDLMEPGLEPRDLLMRLFLYRHTGRVEVWRHLLCEMGEYPLAGSLDEVAEVWKDYRGQTKVTQRGQEARNRPGEKHVFQRSIFTGAYLVFPQSATPGTDKLDSILDLTRRLFEPGSAQDIVPDFLAARTQAARFACLRRNKGVADFMSMQVLTDFGYSTEFRENQFVVPGPGARKGADALGLSGEKAVEWAYHAILDMQSPPSVAGRLPSCMDAQNMLCEFSKWVRYQRQPVPGRLYVPAHPGRQAPPVLPPLW